MPNVYICQRCRRIPLRKRAAGRIWWRCRVCRRRVCEHLAGFKQVEDGSCTCTRCLCLAEEARQSRPR